MSVITNKDRINENNDRINRLIALVKQKALTSNPKFATTEDEMDAMITDKHVGKVVKYLGEGGGAAVGTPIAVGDTIDALYFNTSVTPDFDAFSYEYDETSDGLRIRQATILNLASYEDALTAVYQSTDSGYLQMIASGSYIFYVNGSGVVNGLEVTTENAGVAAFGWQMDTFDMTQYADQSEFSNRTVTSVNNQDYISKEPFAAGGKYEKNALYIIAEGESEVIENPTAVGDEVTQVYFDTTKSAEEIYADLQKLTYDENGAVVFFGTDPMQSGEYVGAGKIEMDEGKFIYVIGNGGLDNFIFAYSEDYTPTEADIGVAEWGWQTTSPQPAMETITIAQVNGKEIWGSWLSAHENGFESVGSPAAPRARRLNITEGSLAINENGKFDVSNMESVEVNIAGGLLSAATEDEMDALLVEDNLGQVVKYVGEGGGAAVGGTENPTAVGDTVTQVYFDTSKSAEEIRALLGNITTWEGDIDGTKIVTLFGTAPYEGETDNEGKIYASYYNDGEIDYWVIADSYEDMGNTVFWIYSDSALPADFDVEQFGWQKTSPYSVKYPFTISHITNKDIWGSFLSAHENGFATGSASAYEKDALYLIAAGSGSSSNTPIALGDTIDKLYFNTSVEEPDFSGLTYDKDGMAFLICGNDHLGLGVFDLAQMGGGSGYTILCNDEFFLYATEDISDFVSEMFETPMTVPKGWNPAYIIDGAFTLPSPDTISEVNQQDAWSSYISKEPFSGVDVIVASGLNATSGSLAITENGTYDITKMASVEVNVASENKLPMIVNGQAMGDAIDITASDLDGVTEIRRCAFYESKGIKSVTLPSTCTSIKSDAFGHCHTLTSIDMPNVTSIGWGAFTQCSTLTSVNMPNVVTIEGHAFMSCGNLNSLTIPSTCTSIGDQALDGNLNRVYIFEGTTPPTITASTFSSTDNTKIIVPKGCGEAYKTATNWSSFADKIEEATV